MSRKVGNLYHTDVERSVLFETGNLGGNADSFRPIFVLGRGVFLMLKNCPLYTNV
jgi:hypothetical protein